MTDETFVNGPGHGAGHQAGAGCATSVEQARRWLAAVLVGAGQNDLDDDLDTALIAGRALSVLNDAVPPPPPLRFTEEGVTAAEGLPQALQALANAAETAVVVADAARIAHAADILASHPAIAE